MWRSVTLETKWLKLIMILRKGTDWNETNKIFFTGNFELGLIFEWRLKNNHFLPLGCLRRWRWGILRERIKLIEINLLKLIKNTMGQRDCSSYGTCLACGQPVANCDSSCWMHFQASSEWDWGRDWTGSYFSPEENYLKSKKEQVVTLVEKWSISSLEMSDIHSQQWLH